MFTSGIDAFLQLIPDIVTHNATPIQIKMNFLKRIIDGIFQLSYCDGFSGINFIFTTFQKKKCIGVKFKIEVATQCFPDFPPNYEGMPDPGFDEPPKNNTVGPPSC